MLRYLLSSSNPYAKEQMSPRKRSKSLMKRVHNLVLNKIDFALSATLGNSDVFHLEE
ncbi:unnamed protein product, partial [Hymenolepis diminuta]